MSQTSSCTACLKLEPPHLRQASNAKARFAPAIRRSSILDICLLLGPDNNFLREKRTNRHLSPSKVITGRGQLDEVKLNSSFDLAGILYTLRLNPADALASFNAGSIGGFRVWLG